MTHTPTPNRYAHLMADYDRPPLALAAHLREAHGIEPKRPTRPSYRRELWHSQHEYDGHRDEVAAVCSCGGTHGKRP